MKLLNPRLGLLFLLCMGTALWQCATRGIPSGGPEDVSPPQLLRTEPENGTTRFKTQRIRLYFDEFVTLQDIQNQLVVSPPLQYHPELKPASGPSKYVEIRIKDTLQENTTYTLNFGQGIVDNNAANANSFLTYVFSTGPYLDSLSLSGGVKDAFIRKADPAISVLLHALDSAYTDSTLYNTLPNYITSTGDSLPFFTFKNLRAGAYKLFALKDADKNHRFDPRLDKVAYLEDTITLPTDSVYLLTLFQEVAPYRVPLPTYVAKNHLVFGFEGDFSQAQLEPLIPLPDSVTTRVVKDREKDTLHYWLTPTDVDSLVFTVRNTALQQIDTFTLKPQQLPLDSLTLTPTVSGTLHFNDTFSLLANTPLVAVDTTKVGLVRNDTLLAPYTYTLDTVQNQIDFTFDITPNQHYRFSLLPGAVTDFFGTQNDTLSYTMATQSYADYGNLRLTLGGAVRYPVLVQLTDESGTVQRQSWAAASQAFVFNLLNPGRYILRVIFDANGNRQWDTGNFLKKIQPETLRYYPDTLEVRANWDLEQQFILSE